MKASVLERFKSQGRSILAEVEAKEVLREAGIPVNETLIARTREEAVSLGMKLGFPVVLKIVSPDVLHKTEAGGVRLNLSGPEQVGEAYEKIMAGILERYPRARVEGVSVQRMVSGGTEMIVGMTKDPQFGPMLMFGLGGILVEVLRDVCFRIVPLTEIDARDMITGIRGYPLIRGFRGSAPVNEDAVVDVLMKLSDFIDGHPEIEEMDINPLMAAGNGVIAADARIVLAPKA
ncbi:MAG: acetate--CoA ligase family protein [Peptococcaceae bacterium]|nr:acetate--CoA ligase family protein [Peptococcaceae bacterium]